MQIQDSSPKTIRGTIKRNGRGAVVAEVEWHLAQRVSRGEVVTVTSKTARVTAAVLDIGARFKRGPFAYGYLYLDVDEPTPDAPATPVSDTNATDDECSECGGPVAAGEGRVWYEAGPDDGGDVAGRTPAGLRVTHRDPAQCEAHRARTAQAQKSDRQARRAALVAWLASAPARETVASIDETDGTGSQLPRTVSPLDGGLTVTSVKRNYPLAPVYYRHTADGRFESLGEWRG